MGRPDLDSTALTRRGLAGHSRLQEDESETLWEWESFRPELLATRQMLEGRIQMLREEAEEFGDVPVTEEAGSAALWFVERLFDAHMGVGPSLFYRDGGGLCLVYEEKGAWRLELEVSPDATSFRTYQASTAARQTMGRRTTSRDGVLSHFLQFLPRSA